jgi:catechol 2,3-dioxygenase
MTVPNIASTPAATTGARLADGTRVGAVELTVTDLDRSIGWYEASLGLRQHRRDGDVAALGGGGEDLVVLHEDRSARPAGRHAGLYHYALLYPTREELGRAGLRLAATRTPIQGASDHGTHEAIYLPDPDGIGIELAWDRARELWPDISGPGGYGAGPAPLDIEGLLGTVAGEGVTAQADPGLRMGHVHLHVGDLPVATRFYRDGLGFQVMTDLGSAVFVSAGGYHHHVGFNVWQGQGAPPAPADAVGLRHWTLLADGAGEVEAIRRRLSDIGAAVQERADGLLAADPSGVAVLVVDGGGEGRA